MKILLRWCLVLFVCSNLYAQTSPDLNDSNKIFLVAQQSPKFQGNVYTWLTANLNYPKQAFDSNIQGTIYITFVVEKDGSISNPRILHGTHSSLDKEALRVISIMPVWSPGMQNGHTVRVQSTIPVNFKIEDKTTSEPVILCANAEVKPTFPGDMDKWIKDNTVYPEIPTEENERGTVYVSFVIEKNGTADDINILRSVEPSLDKEAMRIISSMPKWTPGQQNGQAVRVQQITPVKFIMPEDSTMPVFPYDLLSWIREQMIYPTAAKEKKLEGVVTISFTVLADGSNYSMVIRPRTGYEFLESEASRIMLNMPQWRPVHRNGLAYPYKMALKIPFSIYNDSIMQSIPVFSDSVVQQKPQFKEDINTWMLQHTYCPWSARRQNIEGDITVGFIIEEDGAISHAKIIKGNPDGWMLEDEALKIIQHMVGWSPGFENGLPVRTRSRLTFHFKLNKKSDKE